jgi:predicted small secreted protein
MPIAKHGSWRNPRRTGETTMTRIIWAVLVAAVLAGCNTMHGFGQDVERGGEKIQGAADKNK